MTEFVPAVDFIAVVCTDDGQHARLDFEPVVVRADGTVDTMTTRKAALPGAGKLGSAIGQRVVVNTDGHRDDFQGRRAWRWVCPVCKRDVKLNDASLTKIAHAYIEAGARRVLDISLLPN